MADPMLEDRHDVLCAYTGATEDGLNPDVVECESDSAQVGMVGFRRALVIGIGGVLK